MYLPFFSGQSLRAPARKASPRHRPQLEGLEQRTAPAVFIVDTFEDTVEAARDGSGLDANGFTSLRSAIMAANDLGGEHTIYLPEGTFTLSLAPTGSNDDESGNLNVGRGLTQVTLTIEGAGMDVSVLDAAYLDQGLAVGFFTTVTMNNLTVMNGQGGFGGAVTNSGRLTMADVALRYSAGSHGAGLFNQGTASLTNVLVFGNSATQGGGIHNGGTMTVTTSTLEWNYGAQGGGMFNAGNLTMTASTIADNFSAEVIGWGGGIFNQSTMTLTNSTIAQNYAASGGGIYSVGFGTTTLVNCTVAVNAAYGSPFSEGGGIFVGNGTPEVRLKNTLIANNYSERTPDISGTVISLGTNLISISDGGSGYLETDLLGTLAEPLDPYLAPLDYYGGPTRTIALLAGSVAINAGDAEGAPDTDQRGVARDQCLDIGAYEFLEE